MKKILDLISEEVMQAFEAAWWRLKITAAIFVDYAQIKTCD